jgi:hypothetical protein
VSGSPYEALDRLHLASRASDATQITEYLVQMLLLRQEFARFPWNYKKMCVKLDESLFEIGSDAAWLRRLAQENKNAI